MNASDRYHKWVEWSAEDHAYIGRCPDVITGIHGHDAATVYRELCAVVDEVIARLQQEGRPLPQPSVRPMREIV